MSTKGNIFVVSAASGTGKTSLLNKLTAENPNVHLAISHTTRTMREGEINGKHYYFVNTDTFEQMIGEGAFIEHARVHNQYYGTSTQEIERLRQSNFDVILEIDVQGAEQIRRLLPESIGIFILPPSWEALEQRLNNRGTESDDSIALRLKNSRYEIEQASLFDYLVVNDDLQQAVDNINHIIAASRFRQTNNSDALISLLQSR
ncbi:MAG: guanylate kinase [Neisseriaceae bacterium]|nr:guanylate kinase [Neisseriaceae bacterium]